jgi:hypothetical protein
MSFTHEIHQDAGYTCLRLEISHESDPAYLRIARGSNGRNHNYTICAWIDGVCLSIEGVVFDCPETFYTQLASLYNANAKATLTAFPSLKIEFSFVQGLKKSFLEFAINYTLKSFDRTRHEICLPSCEYSGGIEIEREDVKFLLPSFQKLLENKNAEQGAAPN